MVLHQKKTFILKGTNSDFSDTTISVPPFFIFDMSMCNLKDAGSSGGNSGAIYLSDCYGYKTTIFDGLEIMHLETTESNLCRASFRNTIFNDATFCNCTLDGADFTGASFEDVQFENCTLLCTDFSGVDLAVVSGITQEEFSKIIYDEKKLPIPPKGLKLPKDRAYDLRLSIHDALFVESDNEMLSGRPVDEVLDELLREQDDHYYMSLPTLNAPSLNAPSLNAYV